MKTIEESDRSGTDPEDESQSVADIQNVGDYQAIFRPSRKRKPLFEVLSYYQLHDPIQNFFQYFYFHSIYTPTIPTGFFS